MIKRILVPTDFSACAAFAAKAGALLAQKHDAALHLITCTAPASGNSPTDDTPGEEDAAFTRQVNHANFLLENLKKSLGETATVIISQQVFNKSLTDAVQQYCSEKEIDMIVMGSYGASGKNEYFIGSNTQKVVRKVHLPVLVVKEPLEKVEFKHVVFASEFNLSDKPVFDKMIEFVKNDQPEIHLLTINTSGWFGQPFGLSKAAMEGFKDHSRPLKCHLHFYRDFNVDQGIRNFSQEIQADLITISNHERHPLKRIFAGSTVEALVNHANIPVLSLDFPD